MEKENYFEIKIIGKSETLTESEIIDKIYNLLQDEAEFKIV